MHVCIVQLTRRFSECSKLTIAPTCSPARYKLGTGNVNEIHQHMLPEEEFDWFVSNGRIFST